MSKPQLFIIGVGLIGGSLAKAVKNKNLFEHVVGFARNTETQQYCLKHGLVDEISTDIAQTVRSLPDDSIIIIATPILAVDKILQQCQSASHRITISDVLSSKQYFLDKVQECWGSIPANVVPAHPIAGSEKSGAEYSSMELFENRNCILTPTTTTDAQHVNRTADLWQSIGAKVTQMEAQKHDEIFAATSHLPHLLSYNLVNTLSQMPVEDDVFSYAAGGFRDFTRIAASDPTMWHDICIANAPAILRQLEDYQQQLNLLAQAIENEDSDLIMQRFTQSQHIRQNYSGAVK